jgi:hypothetical protein
VPIGFLIGVAVVALGVATSLWPPSRSGLVGVFTWFISALPNESPFLVLYFIAASALVTLSDGDLHGAALWIELGLAASVLASTLVSCVGACAPALRSSWRWIARSGHGGDTPGLSARSHQGCPGGGSSSRRCRCSIPV